MQRRTSLQNLQFRQVGTRGERRDYSLFPGQMIGFPVHGVVMNQKRPSETMPFDFRGSKNLKPGNAPSFTIQYNNLSACFRQFFNFLSVKFQMLKLPLHNSSYRNFIISHFEYETFIFIFFP